MEGHEGRHVRRRGGVRVLSQQADDDGRGRHSRDRRRPDSGAGVLDAQPGARPQRARGSSTSGSGTTTAWTRCPRRSACRSYRRIDRILARRNAGGRVVQRRHEGDTRREAARGRAGRGAVVVRLHRHPRQSAAARTGHGEAREVGRGEQGIFPADTPAAAVPRTSSATSRATSRSARTSRTGRWPSPSTTHFQRPTSRRLSGTSGDAIG